MHLVEAREATAETVATDRPHETDRAGLADRAGLDAPAPSRRAWLMLALFAIEAFIAIRGFTTPAAFADPALDWTWPLRNRQTGFGALLLGALTALVLARPRLAGHWQALQHAGGADRGPAPWLLQIALCLTCYALVWPLYHDPVGVHVLGWPLLLLWMVAVVACGIASLWLLAPGSYWHRLWQQERAVLSQAAVSVLAAGVLITLIYRAWIAVPLLASLTLQACAALLRLRYPDVQVEPASQLLAVADFRVLITDVCSGYLGVSLTLSVLAAYGYLFRRELPRALLLALLPLGVVVSLSLNVIRIVVLVILGVEVSPEVAVNGFHTNAGSIAMVLGCLALIGLVHRGVVLRRDAARDPMPRLGWTLDGESALLLPMLVLIAATLLTGAASGVIVWLYPLRVLAVAVVLAVCWPQLRPVLALGKGGPAAEALLTGALVFAGWIALVEPDAAHSRQFEAQFAGVPPLLALGWLALRVIGAVITVPIAEELAFRGYLLGLLSRQTPDVKVRPRFSGVAVIVSSLAFGALHGQWLAGTMAGLAYAVMRYRGGGLRDAIAAHLTTNLLLAIYVIATRQWSYW